MHVTDHVHSLPLEMALGGTTRTIEPCVVETDDGLLLVDAGMPGMEADLEAALANAGYDLADVTTLLLTHQDIDHAGGAAAVVAATGAEVLAHETDAPYVDGREDPIKLRGRDEFEWTPVDVDRELTDGDRLPFSGGELQVVFTPGHTPGHVSLYDPGERVLVAGDALNVVDGELVGPREDATLDMDAAVESVRTLAALDVERVLCFHGGLVDAGTDRLTELIDELAEH